MANIHDVAEKAGVSTTTVSHVINQSRFVSLERERRVRRAMKALHYQPNALARSLRRKHSLTLGLVVPDSSNPFFAEVARGIEDAAFKQGYNVLFGSSDGDLTKESSYLRVFIEKQVDGIILVSASGSGRHVQRLVPKELPLVVIDRDFRDLSADYVAADHRKGGYLATAHLIEYGHFEIACIAGPSSVTPSADRVVGYRDALKAHSIPYDQVLVRRGDFTPESGFVATQGWLAGIGPRPTAIFACNDLMAFGALAAIHKAGLRAPDDISVVGFDDIGLAAYSSPPLTTVIQPKAEMGNLAAQILVDRISSGDRQRPQRHLLPPRLVIRESTRRRAAGA
jgi:LacI family transcriptional regulator, galactose operon repressor